MELNAQQLGLCIDEEEAPVFDVPLPANRPRKAPGTEPVVWWKGSLDDAAWIYLEGHDNGDWPWYGRESQAVELIRALLAELAALRVLYTACQELRYQMREVVTLSNPYAQQQAAQRADNQWRTVQSLLETFALDEQSPAAALKHREQHQ